MSKLRPKREGVMLCYPVNEGRVSRLGDFFIAQPKYKGERAHIEWFAGEPVFISSYGNEFKFLDHLKESLKRIYEKLGPVPFDGELYTHGWSQEQISGILRSTVNRHPDTEGLQYHTFDIKSPDPCRDRMLFLSKLCCEGMIHVGGSPIRSAPSILVKQESWMDIATSFLDAGYEGAVLRSLTAPWVPKRTNQVLKFKPTETDEYIIMEVNEAIDKHGNPKSMVGSFMVRAPDQDELFKVGAGKMNHSRREELWKVRHLLKGKLLQVKHELISTERGIPVCAVAVDAIL